MNLLVTVFLACSTLTSTNAVPLASSSIINFFRNEDHDTTTTFSPPLMFGNINQHDTEISVYFENPNQQNQAIAVQENNSQLHSGVSEKGNDTSSNEGNVVPSRVHFPGQNPVDRVPFPAAVSEGEGNGDSILYPSIINIKSDSPEESSTTLTDNVTTPAVGDNSQQQHTQCGPQAGSVEVNGTCLTYLHKNGCSEDEWVVKTNDNRVECVLRPCPLGQLFYKGTCISVTDETVCNDGQMLYVDFTGYVHCDCLPNFIYNPWTGTCFAQGDRATCNFGEHVYIEEDDGSVKCKKNPCLMDGFVFHNASGRCFRKMYRGFCEDSDLITNVDDMTAECSAIISHSLFDLPAMRSCAGGSLRDFSGSCRQRFRVPSVSSYPTLYGSCPGASFVKDSRGTCRRTHKLFG